MGRAWSTQLPMADLAQELVGFRQERGSHQAGRLRW